MRKQFGVLTLTQVAAALSEKYGVEITTGGDTATTSYTKDGKLIINIPALAPDDDNYLTLARGYLDHESAHCRFTSHEELSQAVDGGATEMQLAISNILEDVFVERTIGQCFPGCARNLGDMARLIFDKQRAAPMDAQEIIDTGEQGKMAAAIWESTLQYILYSVRGVPTPALTQYVPEYAAPVNRLAPGLVEKLYPLLDEAPVVGTSTKENIRLAHNIYQTIIDYLNDPENQQKMQESWQNSSGEPQSGQGGSGQGDGQKDEAGGQQRSQAGSQLDAAGVAQAAQSSEQLAQATQTSISAGTDISKQAAQQMSSMAHDAGVPEAMPTYGAGDEGRSQRQFVREMSPQALKEAAQAAAALDARLQALLQTLILNRGGIARHGKLDTRVVHRLAVGDSRVFNRRVERVGVDTEIILSVDMSGSMDGVKADVTSKALFAIMSSLRKIPGVQSSVCGFGGRQHMDILKREQKLSTQMQIIPDGGTLCGEALVYAARKFGPSPDTRKIVLMLTDGDTHNPDYFEQAIKATRLAGIEVLGIGICHNAIKRYVTDSCVVDNLSQLAPEMFRMLQGKLLGAAA